MTAELIIVTLCCAFSLLNLFSTILLSNAIFKLLVAKEKKASMSDDLNSDKGLVDIPVVANYDPRFLQKS